MIEKKRFAYWFTVLGDRYGRALLQPTLAEYYRALSAKLSTEEFEIAATLMLSTPFLGSWPSPAEFVAKVRPDARLVAAQAFEIIRGLAHRHDNGASYWVAREIESTCGKFALAAFRAVGGADRFKTLQSDDFHFAQKNFVEVYIAAVADATAKQLRLESGAQ